MTAPGFATEAAARREADALAAEGIAVEVAYVNDGTGSGRWIIRHAEDGEGDE